MNKAILVRIIGFPATLIHGDPLVLDRWLWLRDRLPETNNGERLIDIGCGTGAFTIGAALRGYESLGLSWDTRNQTVAGERAKLCKADSAKFQVLDVRNLDERVDFVAKYDVAICCENIEHIIGDSKLISDISTTLKPGGRLLLTTPNILYKPMSGEDKGPFSIIEDGGHVRRGYSKSMLIELCYSAGLVVEDISYCSGFFSQKLCFLQRIVTKLNPLLAWLLILPMRVVPPLLDKLMYRILSWPYYSICLEAYKPRLEQTNI